MILAGHDDCVGSEISRRQKISFLPRAGRMPGESFLMRSNSIPKIKPRLRSWRRWMPFFRLWKLVVASAYQFATIWGLCFRAWPTFPSIASLKSRPPLGLSATNRRNPATPSTVPIVVRRLLSSSGCPARPTGRHPVHRHFSPLVTVLVISGLVVGAR